MQLMTRLFLTIIATVAIFACYQKDVQLETLTTSEMTEADSTGLFTSFDSVVMVRCVEAFIIPSDVKEPSPIPLANIYKCITEKNDTVLLLDTELRDAKADPVNEILGIELKPSKKINACKVNVDSTSVSRLRKYKYKYGTLTFVRED